MGLCLICCFSLSQVTLPLFTQSTLTCPPKYSSNVAMPQHFFSFFFPSQHGLIGSVPLFLPWCPLHFFLFSLKKLHFAVFVYLFMYLLVSLCHRARTILFGFPSPVPTRMYHHFQSINTLCVTKWMNYVFSEKWMHRCGHLSVLILRTIFQQLC